jgi:SAM-dependent methyltransferase
VLHADSNLDPSRLDGYASSRKAPELMRHRLLRCLGCGILYAPQPPPGRALAKAYDAALFDSGAEAACAARTYGQALLGLPGLGRRGALDIGTGDGAFMQALMGGGFSGVQGVEPSRAPIAAAPPALAKRIRYGMFTGGEARPGSLDLVTCFQTLEHVDKPLGLVKKAARLLRQGGCFAAVCHDHRALVNRALGLRSPIYDLEHLQLFGHTGLGRLLDNAGLKRVTVRPISNRYPLSYWLRLMPLPRAFKSRLGALLTVGGLDKRLLSLPVGNQLALGWKP